MAAVAPPAVVLGEKPRFKYRDPGRMAFLARQRHVTERKTRWSVPQVEEALRVRLVTNRVMARRAFRALDLDGSGSLCQVEIRKLLHLFNIELTDGDWKKCWAWMDMDGSGALDINERAPAAVGAEEPGRAVPRCAPPVRKMLAEHVRLSTRTWAGAFRAIDAEGSGRVDARQFRAVLEKFNMVLHDADFGRFWREIAGDDGLVDYNMFLQATHDDETLGCRPRVRSAKDDRYAHRMDRLMEELRKKKPAVVTKVHPDYVASTCEDGHMGAFVGTGLCGEYERIGKVRKWFRDIDQDGSGCIQADEIKRLLRSFLINVSDDEFVKMLRFAGFAPGERVNFDRFRKAFGGDIEHLHEGGGIDWGVCEISEESAKKLGYLHVKDPTVTVPEDAKGPAPEAGDEDEAPLLAAEPPPERLPSPDSVLATPAPLADDARAPRLGAPRAAARRRTSAGRRPPARGPRPARRPARRAGPRRRCPSPRALRSGDAPPRGRPSTRPTRALSSSGRRPPGPSARASAARSPTRRPGPSPRAAPARAAPLPRFPNSEAAERARTVAMVAASKPDATPASVAEAVLKATVEQAPSTGPGFTDGSRSAFSGLPAQRQLETAHCMASDAAPLVGMEIAPAEKVSGKAPATLPATAPSKKTIHFVAAFVLVAALTACVGVLIAGGGGGGGGGGGSSSTVVGTDDGEYWTCSDDPTVAPRRADWEGYNPMWTYSSYDPTSIACDQASFGGDPASGYSKWCRCVDEAAESTTSSGTRASECTTSSECWNCADDLGCCANEGGECACDGDWASFGSNGNDWDSNAEPMWNTVHILSLKDADGPWTQRGDLRRRPGTGIQQGYAFDVVTRTCQPDVPVKDRGCYPRANCDADYAARFCDSMTCIPQGFEQECAGMAEFSGHGPKPSLSRSDMFDTDGSTGGQSATFADLAQTTREYYGLTMYTRILRVVEREVGEPITTSTSSMAQFGYLGQWIAPLARTKYATDSLSHASGMASIEGGVYNNAPGASRLPKYLAGASLYSYQPVSDVGRGWGFAERAIGCQYLGLVTLSNRVLVPASGYGFEATQDDREDDGGIFLGAGWVVLPIFPGGSTRDRTSVFGDASFGATTWTHVIDTAQFSGPLLAYAPEFWTRRGDGRSSETSPACCVNPSIYDTFTHKPGDWWPSTGGEFPGLQGVFEDYTASGEALPDDYTGPTYWKIPQMLYPNHTDLEPWQLNARTYNADSYDHWLEVFAYAGESDDELEALFAGFDTRLNGSYHMASEARADLGLGRTTRTHRENATFDYDDADAYNAWNETEQWCWDCTDATECELEVRSVVLESTATLYYRWWRFRDQPAMKQLAHEFPETYTEEVLAAMQKRVELMHEHWQEKDFIKKATKVNHKVELDHRLILDVPDGVPEYGWVPISVAELYEDSTGYGPGIDAGFLSADW
ncbi:hypothetical protein JL720_4429 [Aureococcus anophagefferens]|nr:hypothetical protein JL720_4429 [Aureococcus anophagefferens]